MRKQKVKILIAITTVIVLYLGFNLFYLKGYVPANKENLQYHIDALNRFSFAGEPIPFNQKVKRNKFEAELNKIASNSAETGLLLRHAEIWFPILEPILAQHNIPDDFKYIAVVESGLKRQVVSNRGAAGFWQIISSTGQDLGLTINTEIDERYNAVKATHAVCKHFQESKTYFGSWTNAAAAFNMGMTALIKECKRHKSNSYHDLKLNRESSKYLYKILAYKEIIEHPNKYGLRINKKKYSMNINKVKVNKSIPDLTNFALSYGVSVKTLKSYNPWIKQNALTITKSNRSFEILIPIIQNSIKIQNPPISNTITANF